MALKDLDEAEKSYAKMLADMIAQFPDVLGQIPVKERLAGLDPDELLNALSPEMRAELAKRLAH